MGKVTKNVPSACFSQCQHVDELGKSGEAAVTILPSPVFHLSSDALKTESKRKKQELKINFSSGYLLITIINNLITIINNLINITYNIHTNIINKINLISIIKNLGYGTG